MVEREKPSMPETEEELSPEAVIVLGSGLHKRKVGMTKWASDDPEKRLPKASWDERIRLAAAAQLYQELSESGHSPVIIACGGDVYSGFPPIAWLIKEELVRHYKIPEESILMAEPSFNTIGDIDSGLEVLKREGVLRGKAVIISNGHHLVARKLAKDRGTNFVSAEKLLMRRNDKYRRVIRGIRCSKEFGKLFLNQALGTGLLWIRGEEDYKRRAQRPPQSEIAGMFDSFGLPGKRR